MIIGVPKEIKNHEYRVGLTPEAVKILSKNKHSISIESEAGIGSGFSDEDYKKVGALITNRKFVWLSDIIVKVKEPLKEEYDLLETGKIIFTFFHLPANQKLKEIVHKKNIKAIPYENIQLPDGSRPVLARMSEIAAEVSVDAATHYLRKENGGKGILLKNATAIVIGCEGTLGKIAFKLLRNRGTDVIGFDKAERIVPDYCLGPYNQYAKNKFACSLETIARFINRADVIICAAAQKGEGAPKIITREMLKLMEPGSVIVDPSIDEGGCCETSRPTTHDNPIYIEEGIIHYCVANMPGVVPRSSTPALVKATIDYILQVANKGWQKALEENPVLANAAKID